jgi:hypothetical protein
MISDEDLQVLVSTRMRQLVDQPPAGRDLMSMIRRDSARRRGRIAAVGSSLSVTGVVVVCVGASGALGTHGAPDFVAVPGDLVASASPALDVVTSPAATVAATVTTGGPSAAAIPSTPGASSAQVTVTPAAQDAATLREAPFYYERTVNEQNGIRSVRQAWIGRDTAGRVEQPAPGSTTDTVMTFDKADFTTAAGAKLTWDDFSTTPTPGTVHRWLFPSPASSIRDYGYDLTGTARGDEYAFSSGEGLLRETPTTPAFRLAVVDAMEQVPGVVVRASATDELGRSGIMLSLHAAPNVGVATSTTEDIVDPVDGRLLQSSIVDPPMCPSGSAIWRGVYLDSGPVPTDTTVVAEASAVPTGPPANCALPGEGLPPGASVTSRPAA